MNTLVTRARWAASALVALAVALGAAPAAAADPSVHFRSETVAQLRRNFLGNPEMPFFQYFYVDAGERDDSVGVQAYLGLDHAFGTAEGDVDLYLLDVHFRDPSGRLQITAGRLMARFPSRISAMDGVRADLLPFEHLALRTYVGAGRHLDLDDFRDGEFVAGASVALVGVKPFAAGIGIHVARGAGEAARAIVEADVLARPSARWAPRPYGRLQLSPEVRQVRLVRGGMRVNPIPWASLDLHGGYRRSTDFSALFGEQILGTLASDGIVEAGADAAVSPGAGVRVAAGYAYHGYPLPAGGAAAGHSVNLRVVTPLSERIALSERYAFRAGPGGRYHAVGLAGAAALHPRLDLDLTAALAPYQKGIDPWGLAVHTYLDLTYRPVEPLAIRAGVDVGSDAEYHVDLRGMLTVVLEETFNPRKRDRGEDTGIAPAPGAGGNR